MPQQTDTDNAKLREITRLMYDELMQQIEPDLTTENLPYLYENFEDTDSELQAEMKAHYLWCFETFY